MKSKIAVFTTGWCGEILSQFLKGMQSSLETENADIFVFLCYPTYIDSEEMKQGEMNIFELPDLKDFDCAVIFGSGLDFRDRVDEIVRRCNEADIPVIMQGARRDGVSFVGSDNYQATRDMVGHLWQNHGVRRISYFAGSRDSHDSELRLSAILDYLKENGIEDSLCEIFYTNWENAAAARHIDELCKSPEGLPDAIICANDGLAMETCISLSRNGYEVPDDVLVCGYDYLGDSRIFYPSIASVDQCFTEMGQTADKLRRKLINGADRGISEIIPCRFIPGDSCGCFEYRNSDIMRREHGRKAFSDRAKTTYFNRKLDVMDSTILSCHSYEDFKKDLAVLLDRDHDFEGDSFHILLEREFGMSMQDPDVKFKTKGYSDSMEVIYSMEDGVSYTSDSFDPHEMVPGYDPDGASHTYIFLPIHESDHAYGYMIFRDCIDKITDRFLHTYQNRMALVFEKFRHAITIDQINRKLVDIMRRDPLTGVNNRIAYEAWEKHIDELIAEGGAGEFAMAMFDANSLKLINDSQGHEAGDAYLIRSCRIICETFSHSPVYRIGGDEFVAVLSGTDYERRSESVKEFNGKLSPYSSSLPLPDDYISVACGIAVFDPTEDETVADVIKRADEDMYRDKAAKKSA